MSVFAISDLHLSFGVHKPMDVFGARWTGFEKKLELSWRNLIRETDTVVIPGDISWGMTLEEAKPDFAFLQSLPGQKILLKGNHDYYWSTMTKLSEFLEENGFSTIHFLHNNAYRADHLILCGSRGWICEESMNADDLKILDREAGRFDLSLSAGKKLRGDDSSLELVAFSHYPVACFARHNPILDLLEQYGVRRLYYGHLHLLSNSAKLLSLHGNTSFTLIAADFLQFVPLKIG